MRKNSHPRGYVMMIVIVMGIVLASLAGILLYATTRDRTENKQQTSSMRAVYAAEAAVSIGVQNLRGELAENNSPNLGKVETKTKTDAASAIPGASFPTLSVRYYDANTNTTSSTKPTVTALQKVATGPNAGLRAQQTPIQVFAVAEVDKATASVADAIRIDLIPVFQFGVFFDGDLETQLPAKMDLKGAVHANGNIWLSNSTAAGSTVTFYDRLTSAKHLRSRTAFSPDVKVQPDKTFAYKGSTPVSFPGDLPKMNGSNIDPVAQKKAIEDKYGAGGLVGDTTTGVQPLSVPIRLTSAESCTTTCTGGKTCVKVRASDENGVCMHNVVSREDKCTNNATAQFAQSLAIELIRRPRPAYASDGLGKPYNTPNASDVYTADFGPQPALASATRDTSDIFEIRVPSSVPLLKVTEDKDDPGTIVDRMFWKAHIRIIDGVWYKKGSTVPVFDPELVKYPSAPSATDLNHRFARVLRYSWWWDPRESRVYCTGTDKSCSTKKNHRGGQIRSSDFDMAAFMDLLEEPSARTLLFDGGTIPSNGIILYMSETYNPIYDDANTKLEKAANVRNFLNYPIVHNHLAKSSIDSPNATNKLPVRINPKKTATSEVVNDAPTAHQLGWYPENIWGYLAPLGFRSLTPPLRSVSGVVSAATSDTDLVTAYAAPQSGLTALSSGTLECQVTQLLGAANIPSERPANFDAPSIKPPCIQAGATPLGAENAVRLVRAQTVPKEGFTFVTDDRLYIHGNVNVATSMTVTGAITTATASDATTKQDIQGKVALIADSITIQSEKFDDRRRQGSRFTAFTKEPDHATLGSFTQLSTKVLPWSTGATSGAAPDLCVAVTEAVDTRINASLLMGDVPSCPDSGNETGNKSGGINNFPRFVEDWEGIKSIINGSIVGLFRAERGNSRFLTSGFDKNGFPTAVSDTKFLTPTCIYTAPERLWSFDPALLTSVDNLPPGTPRVVGTERLRWVRR